jgi:hypothetical protein
MVSKSCKQGCLCGAFCLSLRLCVAIMLVLVSVYVAQARTSPVAPAEPSASGANPAPTVTFGIGPNDSVFGKGGPFRVVYGGDRDRRFRLVASDRDEGSTPLPRKPSPLSTCTVTSGGSAVISTFAYFESTSCDVESSNLFEYVSGSDIYAGFVSNGASIFTPTTNFEVRGGGTTNTNFVQGRFTNATTTTSGTVVSYVSAQAGGTGASGGVIAFLEANATGGASVGCGLLGTYTDQPLGFITNQNGGTSPSMWIDTSGDVGIGTTSLVPGQGLTIASPAIVLYAEQGTSTTNPYPIQGVEIANNTAFDDQATQTQGYGLQISETHGDAASITAKIHDNDLWDNATGCLDETTSNGIPPFQIEFYNNKCSQTQEDTLVSSSVSGEFNLDPASYHNYVISLSGNVTGSVIQGYGNTPGAEINLEIIDNGHNFVFSIPGYGADTNQGYCFSAACSGATTLTGANNVNMYTFRYVSNGTQNGWYLVAAPRAN